MWVYNGVYHAEFEHAEEDIWARERERNNERLYKIA
jgi:hypothetical protein